MSVVLINNLTKKYGKNIIFENITINLNSNDYIFLIGGNGTGKSTFIKCILDEINYYGSIDKKDLIISYSPEKMILPEYITINNFLLLLINENKKSINQKNNLIDEYLKLFLIEKYKNVILSKLSKGTKQKIILIASLITKADIYIFDEPLSGLDDLSRKNFIKEVKKLKEEGKMIIISTHHLKEYRFKNKKILKFPLKMETLCGL